MRFNPSLLVSLAGFVQSISTLPHVGSQKYHLTTYFANWGIYARDYFVTDLPADKLSKVNYAFANVNNITGEVFLSDEYSDLQLLYPTDVPSNDTSILFGNFKQLFLLKQKHRQLKTFLAIGGWSYRENFSPPLATAAGRSKFVTSSVALLADLALDGLDIDWEYPSTKTDARNFVLLLKELREALDSYSEKYANGYHFLVTVACAAGPDHYTNLDISGMDPYVDFWNLMAFDYLAGTSSNMTGHMSNIFPSIINPSSTPFYTEQAAAHYRQRIASPDKLILGMPLYGRTFDHTRGMGKPFNGTGDAGSWEPGVYDYKDLPLNGSSTTVYTDVEAMAAWSFDRATGLLVSYDTPQIAALKAGYLMTKGMGGAFWWEADGDKSGYESIVSTVYNTLGGSLTQDMSQNWISYPVSKYVNVRNCSVATASRIRH